MCMESYLTSHIEAIKNDIGKEFWKNYEDEAVRIVRSRGFYSKIKFIEIITDSEIINQNDSDWNNIAEIIKIRNDIIHYNTSSIFNLITVKNAEESINSCRNLVKKFHNAIKLDYKKFALWIDKTQSESYDRRSKN